MGANDWQSLDQLAKNSTIQVTLLSRSSSSCHTQRGNGEVDHTGSWKIQTLAPKSSSRLPHTSADPTMSHRALDSPLEPTMNQCP